MHTGVSATRTPSVPCEGVRFDAGMQRSKQERTRYAAHTSARWRWRAAKMHRSGCGVLSHAVAARTVASSSSPLHLARRTQSPVRKARFGSVTSSEEDTSRSAPLDRILTYRAEGPVPLMMTAGSSRSALVPPYSFSLRAKRVQRCTRERAGLAKATQRHGCVCTQKREDRAAQAGRRRARARARTTLAARARRACPPRASGRTSLRGGAAAAEKKGLSTWGGAQ
jgi:hypothetical protein